MFLNKLRNIFVSRTQNVSAANVARGGKRGTNICVGNNESSFARALTRRGRGRYKGTYANHHDDSNEYATKQQDK